MPRLVYGVTDGVSLPSFTTGQLAWLQQQGWQITVISNGNADAEKFCSDQAVEHIQVDFCRNPAPRQDLRALRQLTGVLRQVKPDLTVWGTPKASLLGVLAARATRTRSLYYVYGLRLEGSRGISRAVLWTMEKLTCLLANQVVAVGHGVRDQLRHYRLTSKPVDIPASGSANGVALETIKTDTLTSRLSIPAEAPVAAFVGRITTDKGIKELIQAWGKIANQLPDAHLLVAGRVEAATDPQAEQLANELSQLPRVHLLGHLPPEQVYSVCDVLVLPSYREGLPTVCIEAAAYQVPSIVTDCTGGADAVIDGVTGYVIPMRDAAALASRMSQLLTDPQLRQELGANARARVETQFSQPVVWQGWNEILYRALRRDPAPIGTGEN